MAALARMSDQLEGLRLSVLVPARNEEASLGACLQSLVAQSVPGFELGQEWELIVIDDFSKDRTREIAAGFEGVQVIGAAPLQKGWTGKANALWTGVAEAQGAWLLFTDADTVHEPGNLSRAIHEAEKYKAGVLSYSPRQVVNGFWQRAVMPLVFSELALVYSPKLVSDPASKIAAANGQFLLMSREAYQRIGGHEAVKSDVLEDVRLAELTKRAGIGLRFRYAPDALSTHMYRSFGEMVEGWTKNLALLFGNPLQTAMMRFLDLALLVALPLLAVVYWWNPVARWGLLLLALRRIWLFYARVAKSNFSALPCVLSPLGLPVYIALLVASWYRHKVVKSVRWKGRKYAE